MYTVHTSGAKKDVQYSLMFSPQTFLLSSEFHTDELSGIIRIPEFIIYWYDDNDDHPENCLKN